VGEQWAVRDSNTLDKAPQNASNHEVPAHRAAQLGDSGGTGGADSGNPGAEFKEPTTVIYEDLGAALALIADLPLTRDEKAEAVRRLLGRR
jgi:hypothetical protein